MICPKCGGIIHVDENCDKCGIDYHEMIDSIRHDEMKKLFVKIEELQLEHKRIGIEESLFAVELINSSLLIPLDVTDNRLSIMTVSDGKHDFILLFTDKDAYETYVKEDIKPRTNPFNMILDLLDDDFEGFLINLGSETCAIGRKFLDKYFLDN